MRTAVWNTGRNYTPRGQRVAAALNENKINFVDVDRNIEGEILLMTEATRIDAEMLTDDLFKMVVMMYYDLSKFIPWTARTEEDRLLKTILVAQATRL